MGEEGEWGEGGVLEEGGSREAESDEDGGREGSGSVLSGARESGLGSHLLLLLLLLG